MSTIISALLFASMFLGGHPEKAPEACALVNHDTRTTQTTTAPANDNCRFEIESGTRYTIIVASQRSEIYAHTFTAQ